MSGFNPFGLSALGSLGSSRLNDMMSSRNQSSFRDRRDLDDEYFPRGSGGRMMGGGSRRRSLSPPRRYNRDDDRRDNRRNRRGRGRGGNDSFGSAGAGILGAAPDIAGPPLSGLSDIGGLGGSSYNDPGVSQLNSQAQQLLNVMQTQQLLAAVQANMASSKPPSLMQGISPRQGGGRYMNQRNQRNDRSWQGRDRPRDNRKRRYSPPRNPLPKRDRRDTNRPSRSDRLQGKKLGGSAKGKEDDAKKDKKDDKSKDSQDKKSEKKQDKKDEATEEQRPEKNAAGEDIEALVKANFDGTRYWCSLCKIVCLKSKNIYKHLLSKRHVKSSVESQGKVFDPAIMEQKPLEESVEHFLKYDCSTRKIARKENKDVIISSQHECTVRIKNFTADKNFMGTEFVKAISGFKCQLCKAFIHSGPDVLKHIQGKRHKSNYASYLKTHPNYPDSTVQVNKNLLNILAEQEGKDVLLFELNNNKPVDGAQAAEEPEKNCNLEESVDGDVTTFNMDDYEPGEDHSEGSPPTQDESLTAGGDSQDEKHSDVDEKPEEEEEEEPMTGEETSGVEDDAGTMEDSKVEDEEENELKDLFSDFVQEDEQSDDDDDDDDDSKAEEEQLLKTPSEEKIPIIPEVSKTKSKEKDEEQTEVKTEEKDDFKNVDTPSDTSFKEEAEDEVIVTPPSARRGGKKGRGRGRGGATTRGTRGTRGRNTRKSGRVAKKEVQAEEAKQAEKTETEVKEKDEEPFKESSNDDISFIDGFEVIDEIVGGEEEEEDD